MNSNQQQEIEEWLSTKGSTLWANWIVTSDDSRSQAAEWFAKEMLDFACWRSSKHKNKLSRHIGEARQFDNVWHSGAFTVDV